MGRREWINKAMEGRMRAPFPLIEIADDRRVLIEYHQGVSSYTDERIQVRVRYGQVCIGGSNLCIARMTKEQLVVCGVIDSVVLIKSGGKYGR